MAPNNRLEVTLNSLGQIAPNCVYPIRTWIDHVGFAIPLQNGIACRAIWQELHITLITINKLHNSGRYITIGVPLRVLRSSKLPRDSILKWRDDLSMLEDMKFDIEDNQGTMLVSRHTPANNIRTVFESATNMIDRL